MNTAPMIRTGKDEGKSHKEDRATLPQQWVGLVELTEEEVRVVAGSRFGSPGFPVYGWRLD